MLSRICLCGLVCLLAAGTSSLQADQHHSGHGKVAGKTNGTHVVHQTSHGHVAHAQMANGKVKSLSVSHKGKAISPKKYKTRKKLALADFPGGQFALAETADTVHVLAAETADYAGRSSAQGFILVGWGFFNQTTGQLVIIWFPVNMVEGGDQGAANYDDNMGQ